MQKKWIVFVIVLLMTGGLWAAGRSSAPDIMALTKTVSDGPHPRVLVWTDSAVYLEGTGPQAVTLTGTIDPNGNLASRVFFLYLQNMGTGEVRYIDNSGLLAAGVVHALNGSGPDTFTTTDVSAVEDLVLVGDGGLAPAINIADLDTGNYQLVLDLREASGQRTVTASYFNFVVVDSVVTLQGNVTTDTTWTSNNAYFLNDIAVFVMAGATLTIEPGTYVIGTGENSALVVARGAKIIADGTKARPIVMTSANAVGDRNRGDWGGLILNGNAPINTGEQDGEGNTGLFGGTDPNDSSGVLRYVRVEFAGIEFSPDNELNGIAFQGVGAGTVVDYIQVHFNLDDSVEFFGGTTQAKHLYLTGNADDTLDWVLGWQGKVQFACGIQRGDDADQGIEADNLEGANNLEPRSNPTIYNGTFLGDPTNDFGSESDYGALLREGTAGTLRNLIIANFKEEAVNVDHDATVTQANSGALSFRNSLFFNNCTAPGDSSLCSGPNGGDQFALDTDLPGGFTTRDWILGEATNRIMDPLLRDTYFFAPDLRPALNSPALNKNFVVQPPDDGFFEPVDYIGCMSPVDDWSQGWTQIVPF